ncbi:MAG: aspartate--tRNA ligase [Gemmatimonadetes bacterium]|nr:aspartate--tRNA ligase [Gemmatimonadota bacterium]
MESGRKVDRDAFRGVPGSTHYRDVPCGLIDASWAGRSVHVAGWVHRRRDKGGVKFVLLRDRTGLVQLAFEPERTPADVIAAAGALNPEDVLWIRGDIEARPPGAVNPDMATGEVEIRVREMTVLASSDPLPILVAIPPEEDLPSEELRLRHRVLDLRRAELQRNFVTRHLATNGARASLSQQGFLEVETPFLTRRTPEGARDYLVPSRIHHGEFYALPQSPQLYKQLLMAAGFDRYFQVARCLRDEDLRADRQPEFTQIDVEMAFVAEDDVFAVCERMLFDMFASTLDREIPVPFPRMTWAEAVESYGTDKPDLRIDWRIRDFSQALGGRGFGIVDGAIEAGGRVRGIVVPGGAALSRSRLDAINETARRSGAKGALWMKVTEDGFTGPAARAVDDEAGSILRSDFGVEPGDLVLMIAGPDSESSPALDVLRRELATELGASSEGEEWVWVTDFPLFEADPETGEPAASHHPFTMPVDVTPEELLADPFSVRSRAYDLVLNGTELASGSIRCHEPALQRAILEALGMTAEQVDARFGFLLEAFRYGVPPHGGFALGLDRLVALMVGVSSLRDVIAFPKTTAARGLMEGAPSAVDNELLADLGIRLDGPRAGGTDD